MKPYINLIFVALLTAGCTSEEQPWAETGSTSTIEVSTYIAQSRATSKTAFADGDVLGLYACQTTGDYSGVYNANCMKNVEVTYGGGEWTYSPLVTWPTDNNEHLSFVAFYPRTTATTNPLQYDFTVNTDIESQTDPLWCTICDASINDRNGKAINGDTEAAAFDAPSGALNLKFRHMLSKVRVSVKLDNPYPGIDVKLNSLSLARVNTIGKFNIDKDLASGSWTSENNTNSTKSFSLHASTEDAMTLSNTATTFPDMLMIPQATSENGTYFYLSFTHSLAEGGEKTVTKSIYVPNSWECDKVYNYVINLSLDVNTISVSAEIAPWDTPEETPSIGYEIPEAIDLGLSVRWAKCDYGTITPYDFGPTDVWRKIFDAWGANWSVPTETQWQELFNKCTITQETVNGVTGYRATAANGNSIFFPDAEYWYSTLDYGYANLRTKSLQNYYRSPSKKLRKRLVCK